MTDDRDDARFVKVTKADYVDASTRKGFKWNAKKHPLPSVQERGAPADKPRNNFEHSFQQISVLRVARCDHCNDKMWGSQLRCSRKSLGGFWS